MPADLRARGYVLPAGRCCGLALPNAVPMAGSTMVTIAETFCIGRLDTPPLAAIALVFPFAMLSAGRRGDGGVRNSHGRSDNVGGLGQMSAEM